jgi:hypothetical protein
LTPEADGCPASIVRIAETDDTGLTRGNGMATATCVSASSIHMTMAIEKTITGENHKMNMSKISKVLGALLLTGAVGSAFAAENAAGVRDFMKKTLETTKAAQAAAAAGDKDGCLKSIKQAKQEYKEITGDAAGKPLQDAMKKVKEAQSHCEAGNVTEAAPILGDAVAGMQKTFGMQ